MLVLRHFVWSRGIPTIGNIPMTSGSQGGQSIRHDLHKIKSSWNWSILAALERCRQRAWATKQESTFPGFLQFSVAALHFVDRLGLLKSHLPPLNHQSVSTSFHISSSRMAVFVHSVPQGNSRNPKYLCVGIGLGTIRSENCTCIALELYRNSIWTSWSVVSSLVNICRWAWEAQPLSFRSVNLD